MLVVGDLNPDIVVLDKALTPVFGQVETLVEGDPADRRRFRRHHGLRRRAAGSVGRRVRRGGRRRPGALDARCARGARRRHPPLRGRVAIPTGATVVLARGADRAILTALGTIDQLRAADVPEEVLAEARHVHVAARRSSHASGSACRHCSGPPAPRARPAPSTPTGIPAERWDGIDELLATADICFPNLEEGRRWTGLTEPDAVGRALVEPGRDQPGPDSRTADGGAQAGRLTGRSPCGARSWCAYARAASRSSTPWCRRQL